MGTLRGLITLALFLAFIGLVVWAWSAKRKDEFEQAGRLPLEDDPVAGPEREGERHE